jgi:hypothetical protein
MHVHGDNLAGKEQHRTKYLDELSRKYLAEIRPKYEEWKAANGALRGPGRTATDADQALVEERVARFEAYKTFLDQQIYAEAFDSRSNLHSSALEEFIHYLFQDLVGDFGQNALLGKSHTFKDVYFAPPSYGAMLERPHARVETKDHDFVIGATYIASFTSKVPPENDPNGEEVNLTVVEPEEYEEATVRDGAETHMFDVPAVAIECKTYLDKTMLEGSSRAASELKARSPNSMYVVVAEWLKLTEQVNLRKYDVDQIYVLRKQRNTDREYRYLAKYQKKPIDPGVVFHLFDSVRNHLAGDWSAGIGEGLERGWLLD